MSQQKLTTEETNQLIALLAKLEPGFLPLEIFLELARLVVLSIVEFVPLRLNPEGEVEVLLISRGSDDPHWPNALHTPGVVVLPTDTNTEVYTPFKRLAEGELAGTKVSAPHFVGNNFQVSRRGAEQAQIYWIEVYGQPTNGRFYPADKLPENIIETQPHFIQRSALKFLESRRQG